MVAWQSPAAVSAATRLLTCADGFPECHRMRRVDQKLTGASQAPTLGSSFGMLDVRYCKDREADLALCGKAITIVLRSRCKMGGAIPMTFVPYEVPGTTSVCEASLTQTPICFKRFSIRTRVCIACNRRFCPPCSPPRPAAISTPKTCIFFVALTPCRLSLWEIPLATVTLDAVTCPFVLETGRLHPISKACIIPLVALTAMSVTLPAFQVISVCGRTHDGGKLVGCGTNMNR